MRSDSTARRDVPAAACTWVRWCVTAGTHPVWRQTRWGLIVHEIVCGDHVADAVRRGYRTDAPPVPFP